MALIQHKFLKSAIGACLTVACGLILWGAAFAEGWVNASYDYLFRFTQTQPQRTRFVEQWGPKSVTEALAKEVVLIQMDNESYAAYSQSRKSPWDRSLHAQLLNRLADDRCKMVIFDVFFRYPGDPTKDRQLAAALRRQGSAVLMARTGGASERHMDETTPGLDSVRPLCPTEVLLKAAGTNNWGVTLTVPDTDLITRRHWPFPLPGPENLPSLVWLAAQLAGAQLSFDPPERWLRYYGLEGAWERMSYTLATNQPPNYFHDKIVFIGSKPENSLAVGRVRQASADQAGAESDDENDKFNTPYTRWTAESVGGMEILATEFLNLMNRDWLRRPAWWMELSGLVGVGIFLGGGFCRIQPRRACALAVLAGVLVSLTAFWLTQKTSYWFPWLIVAGGQVPCALAWAFAATKISWPETGTTLASTSQGHEPVLAKDAGAVQPPDAPDYEIFNPPFGEGAYGKVWLARNAIGQWQALKTVYAAKFGSNTKPYDREFNGIRRFKPISDEHPSLLRVDFVSKKKREGYFYYVMELGDALEPGWRQVPSAYKPCDLARLRAQAEGGRLPVRECVRIGISLAEGLEFLHGQSLTHGDIKPQNIIFVNGQPKLADVGLVAEVLLPGQERTWMGTPGYMPPPPEPPGTAQADIYALGMVLYVIFTGRAPDVFPVVATTLIDSANPADFMRLNSVILKACQPDLTKRFASAGQLADALREVQKALERELSPGPIDVLG